MGKVVNLNRFRKKRAKEAKQKRAEANRRWHGRTKAERARDAAAKERLERKLQGALLIRERVGLDDVPTSTDAEAAIPSASSEPPGEPSA